MFARIGIMRALNRHVERVFDPSRKEKHWGRRKLAWDLLRKLAMMSGFRNRVSRAAVSLLANTKKLRAISATSVKKRSRNYWLGSPFVAPVRGVRLVLVRRPLAGRGCVRLVRRTDRDIGRLGSP
jgi:hypothetical protein